MSHPLALNDTKEKSSVLAWLKLAWVPILLVLVSLGVSGTVTASHTDALSPVDEWVYVDYLYKLPAQGLIHQGEKIGLQARDDIACDGVKPYGPMGPPCGSDYSDSAEFPYEGITSADAYTPAYFAVTRIVGDAIHAVTSIDQLKSWRLTGPLWLASSMIAFFFLLKLWRVKDITILALGLAFIASPVAWWTYSYVSTDAPSFLFGTLLLIFAEKYLRGRWSGWWIPALAVVAVVFKVTNILAVCLVSLYLLVTWLVEVKRTTWTGLRTLRPEHVNRHSLGLLGFALAPLALAGLAQVSWQFVHRAMAYGAGPNQGIGTGLDAQELVSQIVNFLPGTIAANVNLANSTSFAYAMPTFAFIPLSWICITGVLGSLCVVRMRSSKAPLVITVALASLFFAPMLAVVLYVMTGAYFPLAPRYGLPILVSFLLLAAFILRSAASRWIVLAFSAALTVAVVVAAPLLA